MHLQITDTQIGPIRPGMPIAELGASRLPFTTRQVDQEGVDYTEYTIRIRQNVAVSLLDVDGHADNVETTSPVFITARGAHVGSTLDELIRIYPGGRATIGIDPDVGRFFSFATREGEPGGYFYFDPAGLPETCFHSAQPCGTARGRRATRYSAIYVDPMTTLRRGAIGPIQLGMTRAEVQALRLPMRTSGSDLIVAVARGREVIASFRGNRIWMLRTESPDFHWYRGGQVGETLERLRWSFPSGRVSRLGRYVTFSVLWGHVFLFDTGEPTDVCTRADGTACAPFSQTRAVQYVAIGH
jgi:hypothetical protein